MCVRVCKCARALFRGSYYTFASLTQLCSCKSNSTNTHKQDTLTQIHKQQNTQMHTRINLHSHREEVRGVLATAADSTQHCPQANYPTGQEEQKSTHPAPNCSSLPRPTTLLCTLLTLLSSPMCGGCDVMCVICLMCTYTKYFFHTSALHPHYTHTTHAQCQTNSTVPTTSTIYNTKRPKHKQNAHAYNNNATYTRT